MTSFAAAWSPGPVSSDVSLPRAACLRALMLVAIQSPLLLPPKQFDRARRLPASVGEPVGNLRARVDPQDHSLALVEVVARGRCFDGRACFLEAESSRLRSHRAVAEDIAVRREHGRRLPLSPRGRGGAT
ncbi:unnamed protein product [Prorocentrum cordatum]|uniref:Uncharacterized protein n=1 Tax=Prorocentrum cordatum TaxID=2364126 RepID=A0ABN9QYD8_9DINO|nr:unnamed protein product [Polarella glacialis]